MHTLLRKDQSAFRPSSFETDGGSSAPAAPLLEVLWRRRWIVAAGVLACLAVAALYLFVAKPVYSATAKIRVDENGSKVFREAQGYIAESESFMQTQVDTIESTAVIAGALETIHYKSLKTFTAMTGDPVAWLRDSGALKVEAGRKSNVISVAVESTSRDEAARIANAVANAYIVDQSKQKRLQGTEMVSVLESRRAELQRLHDQCLVQMIKYKRESGVLSFRDDKNNTAMEHVSAMDTSLQAAEVATIELRARRDAIQAALKDPQSITAFVEGQQFQGKDTGDRQYDDLRAQLNQYEVQLSAKATVQGSSNPNLRVLRDVVENLKLKVAAKERSIVEGQLATATGQLAAAEQKERDLRTAVATQKGQALDHGPAALEYAKLEEEAASLQKQTDELGQRITEVKLNNISAPALNITMLEQARPGEKAVKPKKTLVMGAALMLGWLLGIGAAMTLEWRDVRIRTPEEIMSLLGTTVVAAVPRINNRLSSVARGQIVRLDARSPVAEAYRSIRTSLNLGAAGGGKTILLTSPTPGDGKSTTASNLALAFAQAGDRTLLLDCDLREPVQHLIFETDGSVGLSSVMAGDVKLQDAIIRTRTEGLFVLPSGPLPGNPSEMLASKRFKRLMTALAGTFDRIIIDSPPVMSATDGRILAASADVTVLVLRMGKSARQYAAMALDGLESVGANVMGAIANDVIWDGRKDYQHGGSWRYASRGDRMLGSDGKGRSAHIGIATHPVRESDKVPAEVLAISEPDWAGDS